MKLLIFCAVTFAVSVSGQKKDFFNQCPTFTTLTPFAMTDYDGAWYIYRQIRSFKDFFLPQTCKFVSYSTSTDRFSYTYRQNNEKQQVVGTYNLADATVGKIAVALGTSDLLGSDVNGNVNQYVVAGSTDATNGWMIIEACTNSLTWIPRSYDYAWVYTRQRVPTAATVTAITAAIAANSALAGLPLKQIDQTGCV